MTSLSRNLLLKFSRLLVIIQLVAIVAVSSVIYHYFNDKLSYEISLRAQALTELYGSLSRYGDIRYSLFIVKKIGESVSATNFRVFDKNGVEIQGNPYDEKDNDIINVISKIDHSKSSTNKIELITTKKHLSKLNFYYQLQGYDGKVYYLMIDFKNSQFFVMQILFFVILLVLATVLIAFLLLKKECVRVSDIINKFSVETEMFDIGKQGSLTAPYNELNPICASIEKLSSRLQAQSKLAAIGQSTAMLAHDVRKPFSLVKSVIDGFERYKDNKELLEGVRKATHQSIRQVERMINDIMDFSREVKLETNPTSIVTVLDFSIREIAQQFSKEDIAIQFDLRHAHKPMLDEERMVRVISNILLNALEAIVNIGKKSTGTVWFKTMEVTKEKKGFVRLTIGNSGPAIPEEDMDKLFESFFTKGKRKGTGIGLASAQKIVNLHGGEIRGRNCDNNEGVEFEIDLPISNQLDNKDQSELPKELKEAAFLRLKMDEDEIEERTARLKESGKRFKVLLIEDEALYRASVRNTIKGNQNLDSSITLYETHTVEDALQLINAEGITHAIVDIDLGEMKNGFDFMKEAKAQHSNLKMMVHTNRCIDEDKNRAFELGASSFVPKPLNIEHLVDFLYEETIVKNEKKEKEKKLTGQGNRRQLNPPPAKGELEGVCFSPSPQPSPARGEGGKIGKDIVSLNYADQLQKKKDSGIKRVLIVNDEEYMLHTMQSMLKNAFEGQEVEIHTALSYGESLKIIEKNRINLVLSDLNLSDNYDGYDVLKKTREHHPTSKLYIVSGTQREDGLARSNGFPIDGYFQLPIGVSELKVELG